MVAEIGTLREGWLDADCVEIRALVCGSDPEAICTVEADRWDSVIDLISNVIVEAQAAHIEGWLRAITI